MITASCIFLESIRKEVGGQETWVGVLDTARAEFRGGVPNPLLARITVHVPVDEAAPLFGIRIVDDAGCDEMSSPSPEMIEEGLRQAKDAGFRFAPFPGSIDLSALASNERGGVRLYLSAQGQETLIGSIALGGESGKA